MLRKNIHHRWGIQKKDFGQMRQSAKNIMALDADCAQNQSHWEIGKKSSKIGHKKFKSNLINIEDSLNTNIEYMLNLNKCLSAEKISKSHRIDEENVIYAHNTTD